MGSCKKNWVAFAIVSFLFTVVKKETKLKEYYKYFFSLKQEERTV